MKNINFLDIKYLINSLIKINNNLIDTINISFNYKIDHYQYIYFNDFISAIINK